MFYIKLFELTSDYDNYIKSEDALLPNVSLVAETTTSHFNPVIKNYLRFVAVEDSSILLTSSDLETGKPNKTLDLLYSKNGTSWTLYDFTAIPLAAGETLYLKGNNPNGFTTLDMETFTGRVSTFGNTTNNGTGTSGKYECHGNVMSLLYGDDFEDKTTIPNPACFAGLFLFCDGLLTAPELPAITLTDNCYYSMFSNCSSLTTAPELPATTLANTCYHYMFADCTSLVNVPTILPATTLAEGCYLNMFQGCTSLVNAPELSATTLADACCQYMFADCTSLINAPSILPATTLADYCYYMMFNNCSSLTKAPELPATTLANNCYKSMFTSCTSLVTAPELPATTLAGECYSHMFNLCTNLNKIVMLATDISASGCLSSWVSGVASTGTFIKHPDMSSLPNNASGIPEGWTASSYFTIKALEDGLTAKLNTSVSTDVCEYRIDNGSWNTLSAGSNTISINTGQTLSFKGNLTVNSTSGIGTFTISKNCLVQGNIMSLLYGDDFIGQNDLSDKTCTFNELFANCNTLTDASNLILPATLANRCYKNMFYGCTSLVNAPELPATTLADECYINMFEGCTSLVSAPELPATTLANSCYSSMFKGCTGLTSAPVLPATTLENNCYEYMFRDCTSLNTTPGLPATTLVDNCYSYMFYGCILLTNVPTVLPVTTLADGCYRHMFDSCTSLTTAPALLAATLQPDCYEGMFQNCSNLNNIVMLATDISASGCLNNWTSGVATTGTFAKVSSMTSLPTGTSGIPEGWTVSDILTSGVCGETLTWYFDNSSLVIEGSGDMYDYDSAEAAPWAPVATYATSIVLPDDITRIGNNAFAGCSSVAKLTFDDNDCVFGINAFNSNTKTYLIIDDAEKKDLAMHPNTYYQIIIKRKLNSTNFGTIVMPFAPSSLTRNNFQFYLIKNFDGLTLTYVRSYAPSANTPYLYKNAKTNESTWASELTSVYNATINATENPSVTRAGWTLTGSYKNLFIDDPELLPYLYVMSGGKLMNYTTSLSIVPFRAYFKGIKYDDWVNGNT